ncbi:hypothetical protein EDB80DRAFT_739994, partial [Ilyonectria destructans]
LGMAKRWLAPLSIQAGENRTPHGDIQIGVARIRRFHWLATEKEHVLVKNLQTAIGFLCRPLLVETRTFADRLLRQRPPPILTDKGPRPHGWTEPRLPPHSLDRALIVAKGVSSTLEVTSIGIRDVMSTRLQCDKAQERAANSDSDQPLLRPRPVCSTQQGGLQCTVRHADAVTISRHTPAAALCCLSEHRELLGFIETDRPLYAESREGGVTFHEKPENHRLTRQKKPSRVRQRSRGA